MYSGQKSTELPVAGDGANTNKMKVCSMQGIHGKETTVATVTCSENIMLVPAEILMDLVRIALVPPMNYVSYKSPTGMKRE
jgi:hypothetical protein